MIYQRREHYYLTLNVLEMIQDGATVTLESRQELAYYLRMVPFPMTLSELTHRCYVLSLQMENGCFLSLPRLHHQHAQHPQQQALVWCCGHCA